MVVDSISVESWSSKSSSDSDSSPDEDGDGDGDGDSFCVAGLGILIGSSVSTPIGANGLDLPSLPSGIRVILESFRLIKATSEKIASFNLMFLTFKSKDRKSPPTKEFSVPAGTFGTEGLIEETRVSVSGPLFTKKT